MSRWIQIKDSVRDSIKESQAFQQLKNKYDDLDLKTKFYVNMGSLAVVIALVLFSTLFYMAKLRSLKNDINEKEETIGYLQRSVDTIRQLKSQQASLQEDNNAPLTQMAESVLSAANIDNSKAEVGTEKILAEEKDLKEVGIEIKLNKINLKQAVRFLFQASEIGKARHLNVRDLDINTKGDESGYLDVIVVLSQYKAK